MTISLYFHFRGVSLQLPTGIKASHWNKWDACGYNQPVTCREKLVDTLRRCEDGLISLASASAKGKSHFFSYGFHCHVLVAEAQQDEIPSSLVNRKTCFPMPMRTSENLTGRHCSEFLNNPVKQQTRIFNLTLEKAVCLRIIYQTTPDDNDIFQSIVRWKDW